MLIGPGVLLHLIGRRFGDVALLLVLGAASLRQGAERLLFAFLARGVGLLQIVS